MNDVDNLVFDVSGLLYRTYYSSLKQPQYNSANLLAEDEDDEISQAEKFSSFALHTAITSMNKFFKMYKPRRVIACFDRPNNWRKQYMASELSISKRPYKGNRRQSQTEAQKKNYMLLLQHMVEFEKLLEQETGIRTLAADSLEADDCIAGWVQRFPTERSVIVSGDSDMRQLINDNVKLCDLTTGELVDCPDPNYYVFEKIFRGDSSDNIASIYPRIRATKIQKAYEDAFTKVNIFAEPYINPLLPDGVEYTVGEAFDENKLLIDLTNQPPLIKQLINSTIDDELTITKRFDFWKLSAFCRKKKLTNITENLQTLRPLFVGGYANVK